MNDYLPGFQVSTVDGGLRAMRNPQAHSVVILGTAGQGISDVPYAVEDPALAAQEFGFDGTLIRAMGEVQIYCDNITLYRMGTTPAKMTGVGSDGGTTAGYTVIFNGDRSTAAGDLYSIYYADNVLYVWHDGNLVFANDAGVQVVDTGDVLVSGAGATGKGLEIGTAKTAEGSITLHGIADLTGGETTPLPTLVEAVTGVGMNLRETYVAQAKAMELLDNFPIEQVYTPNGVFDAGNVALNGSTADLNVLDWLKTSTASDGHKVYHWASETKDSDGATVAAHGVWASSEDRLGDGYREVNFGYQLARFCFNISTVMALEGVCLGFLGCKPPKNFDLVNIRNWIGKAPLYNPIEPGVVTVNGAGLLGIPYLAGCTGANLHLLCVDKASGRTNGFFDNPAGEYDGGASYDINNRPIDIGAYLHVAADWAYMMNGYGSYNSNIAGLVCGLVASLPEKSGCTNKPVVSVTQRYRATTVQLAALSAIGLNMLRYKGNLQQPTVLHDYTVATRSSDWDRMTRQRIKGKLIKITAQTADPFIGECSTDGLQLTALKTALDAKYTKMMTDKEIKNYDFNISATLAQQKIGNATIRITFSPGNELIKLNISVSARP